MEREVSSFGHVLPQETVGVLVQPALPRTVSFAEEYGHPGCSSQGVMAGHLPALVPGELRRRFWGSSPTALVRAVVTLVASRPSGRCTSSTTRVVRSTRVATAERPFWPMIRSPSSVRPPTDRWLRRGAGRSSSWIGSGRGCPYGYVGDAGHGQCVGSGAAPGAVRLAPGPVETGRWSRGSAT